MQLTTRSPSWRVSSFSGSTSPNLLCLVQYICYLSLDVHLKTVTAIYPYYASYHVVLSSCSNDPNWLSSHHIQLVLFFHPILIPSLPNSTLQCQGFNLLLAKNNSSFLHTLPCVSSAMCALFLVLFHSY